MRNFTFIYIQLRNKVITNLKKFETNVNLGKITQYNQKFINRWN